MPKEFRQLEWDATLEDDCRQIVRLAVREDLDRGCDWTTVALVDPAQRGAADVVVRESGVVAGLLAVPVLLEEMQTDLCWRTVLHDGRHVQAGEQIGRLEGSSRDLLTCERPLLNLLGRLSGIATLTSHFVRAVEGTGVRIFDTRKTTPGWRRLEKYAVRCGGGTNHRTGLFDGVLVKDNHLAIVASSGESLSVVVRRLRAFLSQHEGVPNGSSMPLEIEVDSIDQLREVLPAMPDIVLLDNMTCDQLREAVAIRDQLAPGVELEASGGVQLDSVRQIAQTGVKRISAGALTHSARTLDFGLDWHLLA
jgi:nicotinate-nucleotide pyrophosphorylase (carboxylating)